MRFFRLSPDEVVITDGKTTVLVMARDETVELEWTHRADSTCKGCEARDELGYPKRGIIFWDFCDPCPKEIEPR